MSKRITEALVLIVVPVSDKYCGLTEMPVKESWYRNSKEAVESWTEIPITIDASNEIVDAVKDNIELLLKLI